MNSPLCNTLTFLLLCPPSLYNQVYILLLFIFLDLPADTPLTDLSKLVDLDMKKLPDPEESGDRCIRKIQEFLIHEMSNTECGVLPEDKLQRLLVGVSTLILLQTCLQTRVCCFPEANFRQTRVRIFYQLHLFQSLNQLEIAAYIERTVINMRIDSIRSLKSALAGTATSKLTDVLEAVFGVPEEFTPEMEEEEPDEAEEDLPAEGAVPKSSEAEAGPSTSKGTKRKAPATKTSSKRKQSKPTKAGVCKLEDAVPLYPFQEKGYLHTGVPAEYISKREGSRYTGSAVYICEYSKVEQAKGNSVPNCDVTCQQKAQVSSHIRQFHLGNCICCYLCGHRWWSATEWRRHMIKEHSDIPENTWYVAPGNPTQQLVIKTEVVEHKDN